VAVGISASLTGVYSPRTVQIVVTGLTVGGTYEVTGSWAGGSWPVRAGIGTAENTQMVLADLAAPINIPVTYTVVHGAEQATTAELTVNYHRRYVLQSLSGAVSVEFDMIRNGAPQQLAVRQASFMIPGRPRPVMRFDVAGGESGELTVDTREAQTAVLKALLGAGAPMLLRTDGAILDLDATQFLSVTSAPSALIGMTRRRWNLTYQAIDDPEPDTVVGLSDWDDFDASYAGLTWDAFDAEWAGSTFDQFDVYDWATRAAA
jgi:hypothetical protein